MPEPAAYLNAVEVALLTSEVIAEYTLVASKINTDDGYFRLRATLANGDFLEAAEYFTVPEGKICIEDYRYQWMDGQRAVLRRRWDNTPHHPEVAGFSTSLPSWAGRHGRSERSGEPLPHSHVPGSGIVT